MIGNLGRVAYSPISHNDGNNGNSGNTGSKPAPIQHQQRESPFPLQENRLGTVRTSRGPSTPVPEVPECQKIIENNDASKNITEKQQVTNCVPVVPAVPAKNTETIDKPAFLPITKGHGIWRLADIVGERDVVSKEREVCYCCKGTDFWIAGTKDDPYKLCRKCRPPILGAERILEEQAG